MSDDSPVALRPPRPSSSFEVLITNNPPVLESLLAQVATETIFRLYQVSPFLRDFFARSPTSWRYISWRLYQPAQSTAAVTNNAAGTGPRQSSNYALDQILLTVINPFSTRLASLELDNTAVSGATLTSTVLILRRETLQHLSVRGCKNVSLKYHINPWLQMHALARQNPGATGPSGFGALALKSLYTYRCRHHRRRPYLPSSLARKESDSEPTHELVLTCHKLGIWTDTAWCTTPGARCYRRRGYVKMRIPQESTSREVWVVYDRLWRSRNWLGPVDQSRPATSLATRKRKRDSRMWEFDEEAINGEPVGTGPEAKLVPAHLRASHTQFVDNIDCQNCGDRILERCEQCSVMMHCAGCRKTLCASCAFDRPYLRNKNAPVEERDKFWWAPGCAVSPCSMQDQDVPPNAPAPNANPNVTSTALPNIKFRWCCTEPVFSGGGGITFGNNPSRDTDRIRAAPLRTGQGWEDPEFVYPVSSTEHLAPYPPDVDDHNDGPGGRWSSIDGLFQSTAALQAVDHASVPVPRVLCDECYSSEDWKVKCKACSVALCLKHDIGDRLKGRICGYKDLTVEKQEHKSKQKAIRLLATLMKQRKEKMPGPKEKAEAAQFTGPTAQEISTPRAQSRLTFPPVDDMAALTLATPSPSGNHMTPSHSVQSAQSGASITPQSIPFRAFTTTFDPDTPAPNRPLSPASNSTSLPSRSTSPTPSSSRSVAATPEPGSVPSRPPRPEASIPKWRGCQSFFCPVTRAPGDHRRRCVAVMKQCMECKVHVCSGCVEAMRPSCPCKGCRPPANEDENGNAEQEGKSEPIFYCPNCRWDRMVSGKCKRRGDAFQALQWYGEKRKGKRKERLRKPLEERLSTSGGISDLMRREEAIDGLVEFFSSLNAQLAASSHHGSIHQATPDTDAPGPANPAQTSNSGGEYPTNDIRELEDMGLLARDLIRRIQRLREQFQPGSLAALALPNIHVEEDVGRLNSILAAADGQIEGLEREVLGDGTDLHDAMEEMHEHVDENGVENELENDNEEGEGSATE